MPKESGKIIGQRDLTDSEIDMLNRVMTAGEDLRILCDELIAFESSDPRWIAVGRTDLQTGLMALQRAIERPDSF